MKLLPQTTIGIILLFAVNGCVSSRLGSEQTRFREVLLGLYENQVMDNLIRVYNSRPIVQLAYTSIVGTIKDTSNAELGGSYVDKPGPIGNLFNYKATGTSENQLTVTANPIIDGGTQAKRYVPGVQFDKASEKYEYKNVASIYESYINFVWKPKPAPGPAKAKQAKDKPDWPSRQFKIPESKAVAAGLQPEHTEKLKCVDKEPNAKDKFHVKKRYKGPYGQKSMWYYVPDEYKHDYFELAMQVTFGATARLGIPSRGNEIVKELTLQRLAD